MQKIKLQAYFPMLKSRQEILETIHNSEKLTKMFNAWEKKTEREFSYRDIKNVYTIVFLEKSTSDFHQYPQKYLHYFEQGSDSGLNLELLQKYIFVPIDIFLKNKENRDIRNRLNAWLLFLGSDDPEDIIRLIELHPDFKAMYQQIYELCREMEYIMELFSEELAILDRNTVKYMIDEMQEEIDRQKAEIDQQKAEITQQMQVLAEKDRALAKQREEYEAALLRITQMEAELERRRV